MQIYNQEERKKNLDRTHILNIGSEQKRNCLLNLSFKSFTYYDDKVLFYIPKMSFRFLMAVICNFEFNLISDWIPEQNLFHAE